MKCVKSKKWGKIYRVTNDVAHAFVSAEEWIYVPKKEWKKQERK